jgi:hypothetical protein
MADQRLPRTFSGTTFVVLTALAVVAFVAFLVFVSPVLLERTLARVPPPAPHTVAAGPGWEATATQLDEDTACLELRVDGTDLEQCVGPRGGPLRYAGASPAGDTHVVYGIVDPRTAEVVLERGAEYAVLEVVYVDFGFPLGFFAAELDGGDGVDRIIARDGDGHPRGDAVCHGRVPGHQCEVRDLR